MKDGYLTIPEIEIETGIPGSTVRRYLEQHNHTLRTKKNNRGAWLLKVEDLSLMREIRSCYERKMNSDQVEEYLLNSGQPLTVTIDDEQEHSITPAHAFMMVAAEVKKLQDQVESTTTQLADAHVEISELKEQNEEQAKQQQEKIAALTEELKSVSEGIKRMEEEQKKKDERSFFAKLFGKKE